MDRKKFGSLLLVKKNGSLKKLLWWSLAWFIYFYLGCPWPYCVTRPFHFIINTDYIKKILINFIHMYMKLPTHVSLLDLIIHFFNPIWKP